MRRREVLALLGNLAVCPLAARAQPTERIRRIGVLLGWAPGVPQARPFLAAFGTELQKLGWTEGRNIQIDYLWAGTDTNQIQAIAQQLVNLKPDLIIAHSTPVAAAVQRETNDIPVVFCDGVRSGWKRLCRQPSSAGRQHDRVH